MRGWSEKYQWLSSCTGIGLTIQGTDSCKAAYCDVRINGNSLSVERKSESEGSLETVLRQLKPGEPAAIVLTGKGILIKKAARIETIDQESLNRVLPNLRVEDFYVQNFISGEYSYLAVVRKELLDEILTGFSRAGIRVLQLSLGPFAVSQILGQLNTYGKEICFDGHQVHYNEKYEWEDYRHIPGKVSEYPLKMDIEPVPDNYVLPYAAAFQLALLNYLNPVSVHVDTIDTVLQEFREEKKFKFRLSAVLGSFFILLLLNFLLFASYSAKNDTLLSQVNQNTSGLENRKKMEQEITDKEKLLQELGWNKGMTYAFLCDQVGQSVPSSVILSELAVNPLNTLKSTLERKEGYDRGLIRVSGTCPDMQAVNNWIYLLKEKSWVKEVIMDNYAPTDGNTGEKLPQFTLKILF